MSLLKSIADFRAAGVKIDADYDFNQLKPAITRVEQSMVKNLISTSLFTTLDTKYNSTTPTWTAGEEKLIEYLQAWIAPTVLLKKARQGSIMFDTSGSYKNKSADKWFLSEIEQANWEESLLDESSAARELVIQYLEENSSATVLSDYYASNTAAGFRELRIKNVDQFSVYHDLYPGWATFRSLRSFMRSVQYDRIKPVMNGYYTTFLTLEAGTDLQKELVFCAERAIALLSAARAMRSRAVTIGSRGITVLDEKERYGKKVTASAQQIMDAYESLTSDGEKALTDLEKILLELSPSGYTPPDELEDLNDSDWNVFAV